MGFILQSTPEMGEYGVEVRSESFCLGGEYNFERIGEKPCPAGCDVDGDHTHSEYGHVKKRHSIIMYPVSEEVNQGTVEILIEDIPKIKACFDEIEKYLDEHPR